jgi:hypothetical protein
MFGCGDDYLEQKDLYTASDETFYKTPEDVEAALTAVYACLPTDGGNNNPTVVSNLLSDDCFGGGGANDNGFHDIDRFTTLSNEDLYLELWGTLYKGIFRANMILKRFDQAEYDDENAKNQALGEAHFLRAYYHLKLAQFFGSAPLITDPATYNPPQATPEAMFGQIAADLKKAIEIMPNKKFTAISPDRLGHATKWAAEALMARAFLFYTGYYNKTEIALPDGSMVTKANVVTWVDDCIANSGHGLLPDFRNQWPYAYATTDYAFAANNNLSWIGEEGDNIETIFAIKYSPYGGWAPPEQQMSYSNQLTLYMAMRGQDLVPFGTGWGGGPVNPQLFNSFEDDDVRKKGSIVDVTDPEEGNASTDYVWGVWEALEETGLWQKKYTPIQVNTDAGRKGMYFVLLGSPDNYQLWNMQDEVLIRFADVLLMGAELGSANAQSYLDQVRTRAGLTSVPVSLEAIKAERRHELAFEGLRYFDLLRWHDAEAAFALVKNVPVKNLNVDDTYTASYRPETGGFLPIPKSQILLSNGVLKQNPGWE